MPFVKRFVGNFPWKAWLGLVLIALAIQTAIDAWMGIGAEYFNAAHVFLALGEMLTGGAPQDIPFLMGQEALGSAALPIASLILIVQPCLNSFILVLVWLGVKKSMSR